MASSVAPKLISRLRLRLRLKAVHGFMRSKDSFYRGTPPPRVHLLFECHR